MGSASRGNAAEAAVLHALVKRGLDVFVPFGSGYPFDLAVYVPEAGFLRVQCKRGWALRGCVVFNAYSTDHGSGPRGYAGLADLFGVYFPDSEKVFLAPIGAVAASEGRLRFEAPRNKQRKRIRMAADYEIDTWTDRRLADLVAATHAPAA
ncbi:MAG: group I intron-associated PD-(D/E)XK endonuclease [Solirubrobacterales bacterium]